MKKNLALFFFIMTLSSILLSGCSPEREPEVVIFAIELNSDSSDLDPEKFVAYKNDTVSIFIASDHDQTFHIHGYDLIKKVKANTQEVFIFSAMATGRFDIEAHGTHGDHDHHAKTDSQLVAILEIRPK